MVKPFFNYMCRLIQIPLKTFFLVGNNFFFPLVPVEKGEGQQPLIVRAGGLEGEMPLICA